jgi:hypothetical protein
MEKFAVVLEIHRIKNHWHYLYLAVLVACLRSWQFHVLNVAGGEKLKAHQAEENVHPLQFGPDFFVPAVTGFEFCVVPRLKSVHVRPYSQHGMHPFAPCGVFMRVALFGWLSELHARFEPELVAFEFLLRVDLRQPFRHFLEAAEHAPLPLSAVVCFR